MGYAGIKRGNFFLSSSSWRSQRRDGTGGRGHAEAQDCHGASLTLFLIFCKRLPSAPFPLGRLNPKAARSRNALASERRTRQRWHPQAARGRRDFGFWLVTPIMGSGRDKMAPYENAAARSAALRGSLGAASVALVLAIGSSAWADDPAPIKVGVIAEAQAG